MGNETWSSSTLLPALTTRSWAVKADFAVIDELRGLILRRAERGAAGGVRYSIGILIVCRRLTAGRLMFISMAIRLLQGLSKFFFYRLQTAVLFEPQKRCRSTVNE